MKKLVSILTRSLTVTLLAFLSTTIYAQYQDLVLLNGYTLTAYAENSYEISSLDDWNALADYVAVRETPSHNCAGLTFKLTDNIGGENDSLRKPLGRQIGTDKKKDRMRFAGTIEGNGKTLTVAINSEDGSVQYQYSKVECAPIAFAQDATVRDLTVIGTIKTKGQFASGLVGQSGPDGDWVHGTCVIENCHVSVKFVGNTAGSSTYGNHGTFIAIAEGNVTITNCWFDGELTGMNYYYSGGFIGLNKKVATLTNCLFNPSNINIINNNIGGSSEFVHDNGGSHSLVDCYYTKSFSDPEDAQGMRVFSTTPSGTLGTDYEEVTTADTDTNHHYYVVLHNIDWNDIINAIEDLEEGETATMTLQNDVLAGTLDEAIVIPANKTLDLSLNNHILDRGLDVTSAKADGCVFKVYGTLIISGGTVKGGNNTGNGGAIYNEGTLTATNVTFTSNYAAQGGAIYVAGGTVSVNGGTISSNKATTSTGASGSGIYQNAGELTLNGCTISSNKSNSAVYNNGVGVYVADGKFNITGKTTIKDNKCTKSSNAQRNVYLANNEIINITGSITNSTVRVAMQTPGIITNGLGNNKVNVFVSDVTGYVIKKVNDEAKLVQQITRPIESYSSTSDKSDKWVFIASPVLEDFNPTNVNGLLTADYDLYSFDQSAEKEWVNYKAHTEGFVLKNGKGYLYATNGSNVILKFAGDMNTASSQDVDLDYDEYASLAGYNLVGNPFPVEAYANKPYYKMNDDGTNIEATPTSTKTPIPVCTGVIVQAATTGEKVTFTTTAPSKAFSDNGGIQMSLVKSGKRGESEIQDNAIVSFNEGEQLGKFIFNEDFAKLYIPQDGKDYAIVSTEKKGEMPVNFEAKEMGSYTIRVEGEDLTGIYLVDKIEGAVIDLSVNTSYTFIGASSDRIDRFKLVFDAKAGDFADENFAYQSGNEIIVNGEGELQIFDVAGRKVMNTMVNGVEKLDAMPQGVYIFRLIGSEVRTQKIVMR